MDVFHINLFVDAYRFYILEAKNSDSAKETAIERYAEEEFPDLDDIEDYKIDNIRLCTTTSKDKGFNYYEITIKIEGVMRMQIEADSEEEAKEFALEKFRNTTFDNINNIDYNYVEIVSEEELLELGD